MNCVVALVQWIDGLDEPWLANGYVHKAGRRIEERHVRLSGDGPLMGHIPRA